MLRPNRALNRTGRYSIWMSVTLKEAPLAVFVAV